MDSLYLPDDLLVFGDVEKVVVTTSLTGINDETLYMWPCLVLRLHFVFTYKMKKKMFVNTFAKSWIVDPEQIYKMLTVIVFAHTNGASH